jgi:triphosphoribosyl-dephospho-CoA synthase
MPHSQTDLAAFATLACILEASAPKPGNVSPGRPFRDMRYEDFVASAVAIGPELAIAGERPLGATILAAVRATKRWTHANTNLGVILLLAPIARAAHRLGDPLAARQSLRNHLRSVLNETTIEDASLTYIAIRKADPSGLGTASEQDVAAEPTVPLGETMRLAAARDAIAREYVTGFALTFEIGVPALQAARAASLDWSDAAVETFLTLLAHQPDSLIARKLDMGAAEQTSRRAAEVLESGGVRTPAGRAALAAFDVDLRDEHNSRNPGSTADLTASTLFVALLEGGWDTDRLRMARAQ